MRLDLPKEEALIRKLSPVPGWITDVEARLKTDERLGINIGALEGHFLKTLCALPQVQKVVEIGTQYGCSAAWMRQGLGETGTIWTFEKDEPTAQEAKKTFTKAPFESGAPQLFVGAALERLPEIEDQGPFDLIFIDANKSGYLDYFNWAIANTKTGSFIVTDNVFLFGTMFMEECPEQTPKKMWRVMQETLALAFDHPELSSSLIPTQEGLLLSVKK